MPFHHQLASAASWGLRTKGTGKFLGEILLLALLLHPARGTGETLPAAYELTFSWNQSQNPEVAGYKLYYGTTAHNYTSSVTLGETTSATIPGFTSGVMYHFVITAYTEDGDESNFSDEISYGRDVPGIQLQHLPDGSFSLNVTGAPSQAFDVEATADLKTWTVINSVTLGSDRKQTVADPNAAAFPRRFYRTRAKN